VKASKVTVRLWSHENNVIIVLVIIFMISISYSPPYFFSCLLCVCPVWQRIACNTTRLRGTSNVSFNLDFLTVVHIAHVKKTAAYSLYCTKCNKSVQQRPAYEHYVSRYRPQCTRQWKSSCQKNL